MIITTSSLDLKTEKYLEEIFKQRIDKICQKYDLIFYEYIDTGKTKFSWTKLCFKKIYNISLTGELDKVNSIIKELLHLQNGI